MFFSKKSTAFLCFICIFVYLCIRYAALGNLKVNFHCAHLQYLCIRYAALGNLKANFHCTHLQYLCIKNCTI